MSLCPLREVSSYVVFFFKSAVGPEVNTSSCFPVPISVNILVCFLITCLFFNRGIDTWLILNLTFRYRIFFTGMNKIAMNVGNWVVFLSSRLTYSVKHTHSDPWEADSCSDDRRILPIFVPSEVCYPSQTAYHRALSRGGLLIETVSYALFLCPFQYFLYDSLWVSAF